MTDAGLVHRDDMARLGRMLTTFEGAGLASSTVSVEEKRPEYRQQAMIWLLENLDPEPAQAKGVIGTPTRKTTYLVRALSEIDPEVPRNVRITVGGHVIQWDEQATSEDVQEIIDQEVIDYPDVVTPIEVFGLGTRYGDLTWQARSWFLRFSGEARTVLANNQEETAQCRVLRSLWIPSGTVELVTAGFPIAESIRRGLRVDCRHLPGWGFAAMIPECDE